ncbi:hypothetical protein [Streptomyces sp. NPDC006335]|uniref:hypothetical protein n=1 Tax=Streptomyces sp. NPDC006335 TaxID=3156895 RepID=UPI0033BB26DB
MADLITSAGCAAAAIDGPFHGERVASPLTPAEYQGRMAAEGLGQVLDRMADDWVATCEALTEAGIADRTRQAYFGLSMGTRFGLAAARALGPVLKCTVFGKFGTQSIINPGLHAPDRVLNDASAITAPVFFHLQWDDEVFPRSGQLRCSTPSRARTRNFMASRADTAVLRNTLLPSGTRSSTATSSEEGLYGWGRHR